MQNLGMHSNDSQRLIVVSSKSRCSKKHLFIAGIVLLFVVVIIVLATRPSPSSTPGPVYSSDPDQRVIEIFRDYLRVKSPNPTTGSDALAFLKRVADFYGFEAQRLSYTAEGLTKNAVLVSHRVVGSTLSSIFLLSHVDTVGVELDKWTRDPFGGEMDPATGNIYGRGAQDTKSLTVMHMEALFRMKHLPLNRSIYLFFETGEEIGEGTACEPQWLSSALWKSLNVGLVLDEGLASGDSDDLMLFYTQRLSCAFNVSSEGPAGHGSLMLNDTANVKLIKFLGKLLEIRAEQEALLAHNSLGFVTTINPTLLEAGATRNVIPSTAAAGVDMRVTPGQVLNMTSLVKQLAQAANVTLIGPDDLEEPVLSPHNDSDPWWQAITSALGSHLANTTNGSVVGTIFPAGASGACLRRPPFSLHVYGFSALPRTPLLLHSNDEFLNNNTLVEGVATFQALLQALASG